MKPLTEKQDAIYRWIFEFIINNHYPPTNREIGTAFNLAVKGVHDHLKRIEKRGYIEIVPKIARGIKITEKGKNT